MRLILVPDIFPSLRMVDHRSNAFVEAMNGLLQQAERAARGFRTSKNFIAIAYVPMSKLKPLYRGLLLGRGEMPRQSLDNDRFRLENGSCLTNLEHRAPRMSKFVFMWAGKPICSAFP
jgi:hypothetical protein